MEDGLGGEMRFKGRGWTLVGLLLMVLGAAPARMQAQMALTTVQDIVYSANGTPAQGTVVVTWPAFTTAGGSSVAAGSTSVTIGAGGALSIALAPNAGAVPTGTYYTAAFHLSDGTTNRQYWVIPVVATGGAPVKLAAIENQVLPTSMAVQTVSKSYVDAAIARAVTGSAVTTGSSTAYVQKSGDTMSGPLVLAGDPVSPLQAADKNYVDNSVAPVASGMSTKVSAVPAATQTVVQPAGTQMEVNSLNGTLDASGFLSGGGNNGLANALGSANCAHGCDVRASQTYPGTEGVATGSIPSAGHVTDARGGAVNEYFVNPQGVNAGGYVGKTLSQVTTMGAQTFAAAHPGTTGEVSFVMNLKHTAPVGGSNLFPGSHESLPYGKSTFGVLDLTGNYNTQGQHVQFNNIVNCFAVGDCLAGGQFITSSGGYRDEADEGAHPFDLAVQEDTRVFQGTCGTGCTTGSTALVVTPTSAPGTQGDGRFLIDKSPAKVITGGSITGSGMNLLTTVNFSGTNFPVSVFLQMAQQANSQAANMAPGTVTLPIMTSGVTAGVATSTAALPANTGVACVADIASTGLFPNFETVNYTVVDGTHVQLTLNKVHYPGAVMAVGGLCGYGLEETVDTVGAVRQVFPVVGSISANSLYYAAGNTSVVGNTSTVSTSGYVNTSLPITNAVRNGNTVTLTTATQMPYDLNGLSLTVSGVSDSSFNGTFTVSTTGGNTLTYADAGPNGSSAGGTVGVVTGGYNLYPMAEVLSVYNPATATVDGTMKLAPNTVAWTAGDAVEEPHYHQQLVAADTELIGQFMPRPIQYSSAGKEYTGTVGPGIRGWQVTNAAPANSYLGAGGTHQAPDDAYVASGVWRNTMEADAGTEALLRVHCNLHGCNRWNSLYSLLELDSHQGIDFLFFDPNADSATWNLAGTNYSFNPQAFTAPTVNATTVNSSTVNTGTLNATGGSVSGLSSFGLGKPLSAGWPNSFGSVVWSGNAVGGQNPYLGIVDYGGNVQALCASLQPQPQGVNCIGGYYGGFGIQVRTANTGAPIFSALGNGQQGFGIGSVAFTVTDNNQVLSLRNTLDDGSGNATVAGRLTAQRGLASGNGGNTDLVGTLVVSAGATSSATYNFTGGYANAPVCMVQPQNTTPAVAQALGGYVAQVSAGQVSVTVGAAPGGSVTFGYTCVARN